MIGPTIETSRLVLRPPQESDLDGWAEFLADQRTARFVGGVQARSAAWRSMAAITGSWVLRGFGMFSVIEKASGRWAGRLARHCSLLWPQMSTGSLSNGAGR